MDGPTKVELLESILSCERRVLKLMREQYAEQLDLYKQFVIVRRVQLELLEAKRHADTA